MAKEDYKGIWVFAEQENGIIEPTVFELIAKSKDLPVLGRIPFDPKLAAACDAGMLELFEGDWLKDAEALLEKLSPEE